MANYYSNEQQWRGNAFPSPAGDEALGGRKRLYRATINLDSPKLSQTVNGTILNIADTVSLGVIPPNMRFVQGRINSSVSLGTSTIAIGNATVPAKYKAAAVFTTPDTPTVFGIALTQAAVPLNVSEEIFLTVAVAALPNTAGQKLVIDMEFVAP